MESIYSLCEILLGFSFCIKASPLESHTILFDCVTKTMDLKIEYLIETIAKFLIFKGSS